MQSYRQLTFRPARTPGILSPVTARSTGHYRLVGRKERNAPRPFTQLFWVAAGELAYERGGRLFRCGPGGVFWYSPREPHQIETVRAPGEYYWITYDNGWVADWLSGISVDPGPRAAGPCPVRLFVEIRETISLPSVGAEKQASELGLRLLMAFADATPSREQKEPAREEQLCQELEARIGREFRDPDFGIETAARQMGVHRTTLFRIYREKRGIAPSAYLQRTRLRQGLELLRQGTLNISEAALASGYRDPNYFSKVIRRATGESPRLVRRG